MSSAHLAELQNSAEKSTRLTYINSKCSGMCHYRHKDHAAANKKACIAAAITQTSSAGTMTKNKHTTLSPAAAHD
jgi:hypothetical protein